MREYKERKWIYEEVVSCDVCGRSLEVETKDGIKEFNQTTLEKEETLSLCGTGGYCSIIGDGSSGNLIYANTALLRSWENI